MVGLLCVLALAGCGNKSKAAGPTTVGTKTPITFSYWDVMGAEDIPWTDPVAKKVTEITGVSLQYQHPVGGQPLEAVPLMIASGDYPDLLYVTTDLPSILDADVLIPLDELIEKYGKYSKEHYGPYLNRLRNSLEDPHIYVLGNDEMVKAKWEPIDATYMVQHAVLKDLGYPKMQTLDDVEKAIRAYKAKYPTINGQPTLGISMVMPFWWLLQIGNTAMFMIGEPDNGEWIINPNTLQAQYKYLAPGMDIFIRWLNKMNAEGLLDPECFTQTFDEFQAKVAAGRVLSIPYPYQYLIQARQSLINDGMPERTFAYLPIAVNENVKLATLKDPGFSGGWGVGITRSCKDPERAFEFLDWMCSEEAQILTHWGIEGVNYTVQNGKRVMSAAEFERYLYDTDYPKTTGVNYFWSVRFPQRGAGYIDSTGNFNTPLSPEIIKDNYLPVERETLRGYGVEMWIDLFPPTSSLGDSRWGQAWQITLTPDIQLKYMEGHAASESNIGKLVAGRPQDFDANWATYINELRSIGMVQAGEGMTALVKGRIQLWE
jgi:putative aldouronate transport system substrate-binding protein